MKQQVNKKRADGSRVKSLERSITAQLDKMEMNFSRDLAELRELLQVYFYRKRVLNQTEETEG